MQRSGLRNLDLELGYDSPRAARVGGYNPTEAYPINLMFSEGIPVDERAFLKYLQHFQLVFSHVYDGIYSSLDLTSPNLCLTLE